MELVFKERGRLVQPPAITIQGKRDCNSHCNDHRRLVLEGMDILNSINDSLDPVRKTFELIGGYPQTMELKSFWWKAKYCTCNEVYSLCLPKKNLEANLRNHVGGTKHTKILQAEQSRRSSVLSGKRGCPSKSTGDTSGSSQKQLHAFF